ncbi:AbrB family transcriptional regulator [Leptolyngbya sp. FACHB-17]|uniref:AbrB/MazE/SpoVT family DNA-binding domain-containing protein n=1 Tax=unclassified Leptolyngbya TaxID=2650499 RepID=UPI001680A215|nr:AbrB family transcriptional regulator [Leptolyngbya sp. FACHB-17]MBD2078335.1 AbrB family transcriptional regulator [Leptolyngbya sp. FACHB-17]
MLKSTITAEGKALIPEPVQQLLNLQPGDQIDFVITNDGKVYVQPAAIDVRELSGILYQPNREPVSLEEMDAAIAEGAGESA